MNAKALKDFLNNVPLKKITEKNKRDRQLIEKVVLLSGQFEDEGYYNRYEVKTCRKCKRRFVTMKNNKLSLCFPVGRRETEDFKWSESCKFQYGVYRTKRYWLKRKTVKC